MLKYADNANIEKLARVPLALVCTTKIKKFCTRIGLLVTYFRKFLAIFPDIFLSEEERISVKVCFGDFCCNPAIPFESQQTQQEEIKYHNHLERPWKVPFLRGMRVHWTRDSGSLDLGWSFSPIWWYQSVATDGHLTECCVLLTFQKVLQQFDILQSADLTKVWSCNVFTGQNHGNTLRIKLKRLQK